MIYTMPFYDILTNIFLCTIDMCILLELMKRMYGPVRKYRKAAVCLAVFIIFLLMLLPSPYDNGFFIVPASILLLPFYPKNPKRKLLFESCLFTIAFSYLFVLNDVTNILPRGNIWIMWYLIAYHAGLWGILFLCLKLCSGVNVDFPFSLWFIFLLIPVSTLASSVSLIFIQDSTTLSRPASDIFHMVIQTSFLFINIFLFDLFRRFSLYTKKEQEKMRLEQQIQYQNIHYKGLLHSSSQIKQIRHDMKNHLQTISLLYKNGASEELTQYIDETTQILQSTEAYISTGNPGLDAILNIKLNELKEKGVSCTPHIVIPQNLHFPFSDAVIIIGNLLDNALAACMELPGSHEAELSIIYQNQTLLLHMCNPSSAKIPTPYGTGMQNVENIVRKYSGLLNTQIKDGYYVTDVMLNF